MPHAVETGIKHCTATFCLPCCTLNPHLRWTVATTSIQLAPHMVLQSVSQTSCYSGRPPLASKVMQQVHITRLSFTTWQVPQHIPRIPFGTIDHLCQPWLRTSMLFARTNGPLLEVRVKFQLSRVIGGTRPSCWQ